jgi:hypothetical protein
MFQIEEDPSQTEKALLLAVPSAVPYQVSDPPS